VCFGHRGAEAQRRSSEVLFLLFFLTILLCVSEPLCFIKRRFFQSTRRELGDIGGKIMSLTKWSSNLEIGIGCIDADHKVLVSLINQVHDCSNLYEELMVLGSVLSALIEYTVYHFNREEKLQELCGYSQLEAHKTSHHNLTIQAQSFYKRYVENPADLPVAEIKGFLRNWLFNHIMIEDFAFRPACLDNKDAIAEVTAMTFMKDHAETSAPVDWGRLSVLIIDDNPNFRLLIKTVLRAVGVRNVQEAASADDGLKLLIKRPVDVVLCDWVMEGMHGAEFARRLREFDDSSLIVLVTGHAVETHREQASASGVIGFLQKPISVRSLVDVITEVLSK